MQTESAFPVKLDPPPQAAIAAAVRSATTMLAPGEVIRHMSGIVSP